MYLLFIDVLVFVVILEVKLDIGCKILLNNLTLDNAPDDGDEYVEHLGEIIKEEHNSRRQVIRLGDVINVFRKLRLIILRI